MRREEGKESVKDPSFDDQSTKVKRKETNRQRKKEPRRSAWEPRRWERRSLDFQVSSSASVLLLSLFSLSERQEKQPDLPVSLLQSCAIPIPPVVQDVCFLLLLRRHRYTLRKNSYPIHEESNVIPIHVEKRYLYMFIQYKGIYMCISMWSG